MGDEPPLLKHEPVSAGASQLLLPWVNQLLEQTGTSIKDLDVIAIGVGPGAFTGVRLGVAAVQGLAIARRIPVIPVASLDAIAAQLMYEEQFISARPKQIVIAIDARMHEIYWAQYQVTDKALPIRMGDITLSKPEDLELEGIESLLVMGLKNMVIAYFQRAICYYLNLI